MKKKYKIVPEVREEILKKIHSDDVLVMQDAKDYGVGPLTYNFQYTGNCTGGSCSALFSRISRDFSLL